MEQRVSLSEVGKEAGSGGLGAMGEEEKFAKIHLQKHFRVTPFIFSCIKHELSCLVYELLFHLQFSQELYKLDFKTKKV